MMTGISYALDLFGQALWSIKDNRLRTILSILGVAIGITAVMAVGTISKGGRHLIFSELETFGLKSIWIFRDQKEKNPSRAVRSGTGVVTSDYLEIRSGECCPAVNRITPIINSRVRQPVIRFGDKYSDARIFGVNEDYLAINNDHIINGRAVRTEDIKRHRNFAVIGTQVQTDLFGENMNPIGQQIVIGRLKFDVIGILGEKSRDFLASIGSSGGQNANNRILIPFTSYQRILGMNKEISWLQLEATTLKQANTALSQVISILKRYHKGQFEYRGETMAQYIETANRILKGVSLIGIVAASVSLLVGGMGIMNIMSTSVLERTREIGLRKATGALKKDILFQFLMEAVVISGIGGILGLVFGLSVSFILAYVTGFPVTLSWVTVIVGLLVSIGVGLVSGYYPAYRAANMEPVVALRYE